MSDKLLVEIEMFDGNIDDAVPALIFLAHELVECGTFEISQPVRWNEKTGAAYRIKWRFSEDEIRIPVETDGLHDLHYELEKLTRNLPPAQFSAIHKFKKLLAEGLEDVPCLYAEAA